MTTTKGTGTYDDPIIVNGLVKKDGKYYKLATGNDKYIPLKGTNNLVASSQFTCHTSGVGGNITIGCYDQAKTFPYKWRTGGLLVLNAGDSDRNGACQFFASKQIGTDVNDGASFQTTSISLQPDGQFILQVTDSDHYIETIPSYVYTSNSSTHCYLFRDNFCIQIGRAKMGTVNDKYNSYGTVNLLRPYKDDAYFVFAQARDPDNNLWGSITSVNANSKTTTSFNFTVTAPQEDTGTWNTNINWSTDWITYGFIK